MTVVSDRKRISDTIREINEENGIFLDDNKHNNNNNKPQSTDYGVQTIASSLGVPVSAYEGAYDNNNNNNNNKATGPLRIVYSIPRISLMNRRHQQVLINKDSAEDAVDIRGLSNGVYNSEQVYKKEIDVGVQAVKTVKATASQTPYYRKVNTAVQAEPTVVDSGHSDPLMGLLDPITGNPLDTKKLTRFLNKTTPRVLHHVTQNNEIQIYKDDYMALGSDENIIGQRDDTFLKERGNFSHILTRGRSITSLDWLGSRLRDDYVAVATSPICTSIKESFEMTGKCDSNISLIWDLQEPMHPKYILESPEYVNVIKFNPSRPNIIVGGCANGQVVVWDTDVDIDKGGEILSRSNTNINNNNNNNNNNNKFKSQYQTTRLSFSNSTEETSTIPEMPEPIKGLTLEQYGDRVICRLQPTQVSKIESMHKKSINDICWVSDGFQFTFDGKLVHPSSQGAVGGTGHMSSKPINQRSTLQLRKASDNQFIVISLDGTLTVWDLRTEYLPQDRLRKMRHISKTANEYKVWVPLLKHALVKPDGTGEILGMRVAMESRRVSYEYNNIINNSNYNINSINSNNNNNNNKFGYQEGGLLKKMSSCFPMRSTSSSLIMSTLTPSYQLAVSSAEGELCLCTLAPKEDLRQLLSPQTTHDPSDAKRIIKKLYQAHPGPCTSVQHHPMIPDTILTCGGWTYKIWRKGVHRPIITSVNINNKVTCCRWSPTRPCVIFTGTEDGIVQIWDLLDRTHEPVLEHHVTTDSITSLELKPLPDRRSERYIQQLLVGSKAGTFHWYSLPSTLTRGPYTELSYMCEYIEREVKRVVFASWRWEERARELKSIANANMERNSSDINNINDNFNNINNNYDECNNVMSFFDEYDVDLDEEEEFNNKIMALQEVGDDGNDKVM